jgi:hypothetical protein
MGAAMSKVLRPHTPEWFAELRQQNPHQASHVKQILELAGTDQCCSICGDTDKIKDYMADEGISARLCDDCKRIQEQTHGARFLPLPG